MTKISSAGVLSVLLIALLTNISTKLLVWTKRNLQVSPSVVSSSLTHLHTRLSLSHTHTHTPLSLSLSLTHTHTLLSLSLSHTHLSGGFGRGVCVRETETTLWGGFRLLELSRLDPSPQKALRGVIPSPFLEPFPRSWSHFDSNCYQKLTNLVKVDFETPPRRALRGCGLWSAFHGLRHGVGCLG